MLIGLPPQASMKLLGVITVVLVELMGLLDGGVS